MSNNVLESKNSFGLVRVFIKNGLQRYKPIISMASTAAKIIVIPTASVSSADLYIFYMLQIKPSMALPSDIWCAASTPTLTLPDFIQNRAIRLLLYAAKIPYLRDRRAVVSKW